MARAGAALGWLSTALALALAAALFFRPLLPLPRPTHYVGGDFLSYFYPIYHYVAEEVAAGRLPHWTPFVGAGYPLLADIEAGVLYPPARLLGLLAGPPSYVTLELYALAHYLVAGLGMLALGSQAGLGPLPAGVGALVLMLSGFLWAHAAHLSILQSAAWLPWLLAAHARALETPSVARTVVAGGLVALLLLGGHPQIALYGVIAVGLLSLAVLGRRWRALTRRGRVAMPAVTLAALLLGAALAGPQLAVTLSILPDTPRHAPRPEFLAEGTLPVPQLLTFLVPLAYLGTERFRSTDEFFAYVGIGALLLASAAVVLRPDTWSRYFLLLVVGGLALALAPDIPGVVAVLPHLGALGAFRESARAIFLTDLGIAGLAALGLDAWTRAIEEGPARTRALVVGWRLAAALALALAAPVWLGRLPAAAGPFAASLPAYYGQFLAFLLAHLATLELWRAGRIRRPLAIAATVAVIAVNLIAPHRMLAWTPRRLDEAWTPTAVVRQLQAEPGRARVWSEGDLHGLGRLVEVNAGLVDRLEVFAHDTQLSPIRYDQFTRTFGSPRQEPLLADLLDIRYVLAGTQDRSLLHLGRYGPPRLRTGEERRYDLRTLLTSRIGEVGLVARGDPGGPAPASATVSVAGGDGLEVCIGCRPAGASGTASVTRDGPVVSIRARLPQRGSLREIHLVNRFWRGVTVETLRLDDIDVYALGRRYRRLYANVWENTLAGPRAFLVEAVTVQPDPSLNLLALLQSDPRRRAVTETAPRCQPDLAAATVPPAPVQLVEYEPMRVRLRTRHERPAFLVLADAFDRQWGATVDGQPTRVYPTDRLLRGVCVPAGDHEVEFRYHPRAFRRGVVLAVAGSLGAGMALVVERRWRR